MPRNPTRRLLLSAAISSLALLMIAGCGSTSTSSDSTAASAASPAAADLAGSSWTLASYIGPEGAEVPAAESANQGSLAFGSDGTFSGSTGCNRIAGGYTQAGAALTLEPGPMTLMACVGPVQAQETAVVAALPLVASFTSGDALILAAADGSTLLTYSPGLTDLAGTAWQATGINNGKEAVVAMAGTENVTAAFGTDGQLSGSGGCNSYSGTFSTADPDLLTIGTIAATEKACLEDTVTQIESEYFAALAKVAAYEVEANRLTLRDADGATQVTYVRTA